MEDLENKELVKIMWIPGTKKVLWNMKNEKQYLDNKLFYVFLNSQLNLNVWVQEYTKLYRSWLENDDVSIFDLNHKINFNMIKSIKKFNMLSSAVILFYWFDVERSSQPEFQWEKCPKSQSQLISLGDEFHYLNRFVSKDYLVLPDMRRNIHGG